MAKWYQPDLGGTEILNWLWHKIAGNPGAPVDAQAWYDTVANRFKGRVNGVTKTFAHTDELASGSVTAVTATAPVNSSGGTAPDISVDAASAATANFLVRRDANGRAKIADAVADDDLPGWGQVKAWAAGARDPKDSVRAATTVAGTLATSFENGDAIDGVTLATGDRILIKNQAAPADNGIYVVAASGAPARANDADSSADVTGGMTVPVTEGTVNADHTFMLATNDPIVLGTTGLSFVDLGSTLVQAGAGLTKTADALDVGEGFGLDVGANDVGIDKTLVSVTRTADVGVGSATSFTISNGGFFAATRAILVQVWLKSTGAREYPDILVEADGDIVVDFTISKTGSDYAYVAMGPAA